MDEIEQDNFEPVQIDNNDDDLPLSQSPNEDVLSNPATNNNTILNRGTRSGTMKLKGWNDNYSSLKSNNTEEKKLVNVVIEARSKGKFVYYLKIFVIICRMFILVSPSISTNLKKEDPEKNKLIYELNFIASIVVLIKILLVLRQKRRHYFRRLSPCIDFLGNCGVFMASLIYFLCSSLKLAPNSGLEEQYYFWAACCFCNVIAIFNHISQFKLVSEILSVIGLAIKINYPFLYVIVMNYFIFGVVGGYIFGGNINSSTPKNMDNVGQETKPEYVYQNWNDYLNSLVYLYGINLNNNMTMYISFSTVNEGPYRNYKPIFFFLFYLFNNMILRSIFIGQIIEISLHFFKTIAEEENHVKIVSEDNSVVHGKGKSLGLRDYVAEGNGGNKMIKVKI